MHILIYDILAHCGELFSKNCSYETPKMPVRITCSMSFAVLCQFLSITWIRYLGFSNPRIRLPQLCWTRLFGYFGPQFSLTSYFNFLLCDLIGSYTQRCSEYFLTNYEHKNTFTSVRNLVFRQWKTAEEVQAFSPELKG